MPNARLTCIVCFLLPGVPLVLRKQSLTVVASVYACPVVSLADTSNSGRYARATVPPRALRAVFSPTTTSTHSENGGVGP